MEHGSPKNHPKTDSLLASLPDVVEAILAAQTSDLTDEEVALLNQYSTGDVAPLLAEQFKTSGDLWISGRAFDGLMRLAGFDQVGFLIDTLDKSPDVVWRTIYCQRLGTFDDARAITALRRVLETDPDADTRFVAAEALGEIGDGTVLDALAEASKHDKGVDYEGWPVSGAAEEAIRKIRARLGLNPP